jgi:hypothetical protein
VVASNAYLLLRSFLEKSKSMVDENSGFIIEETALTREKVGHQEKLYKQRMRSFYFDTTTTIGFLTRSKPSNS